MKTVYFIKNIALLFGSAIFLCLNHSLAQSDVLELMEGAEDIRLDTKGNMIIKGNVVFKKEGTTLFCDSAYYNIKQQKIRAFGNVHLNKQDTLNMFCDSLFVDTKKQFAKLWGNVSIRDLEYKLETDSLDYDLKINKGVYKNGGVITSILSPDKLTSKIGYFFPEQKNFFFRGQVRYTNLEYKVETDTLQFNGQSKKAYFFGPTHIYSDASKMYCENGWYDIPGEKGVLQKNAWLKQENTFIGSDSLFYSSLDSIYIASGSVVIKDSVNRLEFNGDFAKSEEKKKYAFITGRALAKRYENEDTLFIHGDTLYNHLDSIGQSKRLLAYNKVNIYREDTQGKCDSLSFDVERGELNMYQSPVLWAKDAQLSGDTITVFEKEGKIDRALIRKKGLVITHLDSSDYYNQVNGTYMTAYFDSSKVSRVDIVGNAKTVYYLEEETEEDTVVVVNRKGMNRIYASNISLYFENGDITRAVYRERPDGALYPMDQIKESEKIVDDFKWNEHLRPRSWQQMIQPPDEP
ncbi:MAG: OstA-like protein [Brumimicrobium sp.]|nr:OstA-like protein [Brumimicrobium sp.]